MRNDHILSRMRGIRQQLLGAYAANSSLSSATKGGEREAFIDKFLSLVLPQTFRFGTGDATDQGGKRSGQLDVVVEYPFLPSLPIVGGGHSRLYIAEGIAAVIEVKSDVRNQWSEVLSTAEQLHQLTRNLGVYSRQMMGGTGTRFKNHTVLSGMVLTGGLVGTGDDVEVGGQPMEAGRIPLFAVGYKGWKTVDSIERHLAEGFVDGVLVIEDSMFVSSSRFGSMKIDGDGALWAFICALNDATRRLSQITSDPLDYVRD